MRQLLCFFLLPPTTCIILWIYPRIEKQAGPLTEPMLMRTASKLPFLDLCVCLCPLQCSPYPLEHFPNLLATLLPPVSCSYWSSSISCSYWSISISCSYWSTSPNLESLASFCGHSQTWIGSSCTYMRFGLRTPSIVCTQSLNTLLSSVTKGQVLASNSSQSLCVNISRIALDLTEALVRCKTRQPNNNRWYLFLKDSGLETYSSWGKRKIISSLFLWLWRSSLMDMHLIHFT